MDEASAAPGAKLDSEVKSSAATGSARVKNGMVVSPGKESAAHLIVMPGSWPEGLPHDTVRRRNLQARAFLVL
ncbi:hypothetical protein PSUB009319_13160 [Ralstonia sp. SET104]|nr:hypothetical protein PSUB009319_13160 [Ralstonia sp. SET104]